MQSQSRGAIPSMLGDGLQASLSCLTCFDAEGRAPHMVAVLPRPPAAVVYLAAAAAAAHPRYWHPFAAVLPDPGLVFSTAACC